MFRLVTSNLSTLRPIAATTLRRSYHSATTKAIHAMSTTFVPEDWTIIETSPGGVDKDFANTKTGETTWYTPKGASAEEILRVPGATKYWNTVKDVERYMKKMEAQKKSSGGKDYSDA